MKKEDLHCHSYLQTYSHSLGKKKCFCLKYVCLQYVTLNPLRELKNRRAIKQIRVDFLLHTNAGPLGESPTFVPSVHRPVPPPRADPLYYVT